MCLAVPGKVLSVEENASGVLMGTVGFGGITKEVCLASCPPADSDCETSSPLSTPRAVGAEVGSS
jgi:hydrogenase maturation factor